MLTGALLQSSDKRFPNLLNSVGRVFNGDNTGVTDVHSLLQAEIIAAAADGQYLRLKPGTYKLSQQLSLPSNTVLIGTPEDPSLTTLILSQNTNQSVLYASSKTNIYVSGFTVDNNYSSGIVTGSPIYLLNSDYVHLDSVVTLNANDYNLYAQGSDFLTVTNSQFNDSPANEGVYLNDCDDFLAINTEASGNSRFGFYLTGKCQRPHFIDVRANGNGLEGIGARWGSNYGVIIGGEFNDCVNDNGISITGDYWTVSGAQCNRNAIYGICLWGSHNSIQVTAMDNNQLNSSEPYSGVGVQPAFGGTGRHNTIIAVAGDTQSSPTQKYGVFLRGTAYTDWANGQTFNINSGQVYRTHNTNLYEALTSGTTATGSEPTHTSGTATGADGIEWEFIASTTATEDFNAAWNTVTVSGRNNTTALHGKSAASVYNRVNGAMRGTTAQIPPTGNSVAGDIYWDTGTGTLKAFNGTSWNNV